MSIFSIARRALVPALISAVGMAQAPEWRMVGQAGEVTCYILVGSATRSKRGVKAKTKFVLATPKEIHPDYPKIAYFVKVQEFSRARVWTLEIISFGGDGRLIRKTTNLPTEPGMDIAPGSLADLQSKAAFEMVETEKPGSKSKR